MGCFDVPWKVCLHISHWIVCAAYSQPKSAQALRPRDIAAWRGLLLREREVAELTWFVFSCEVGPFEAFAAARSRAC